MHLQKQGRERKKERIAGKHTMNIQQGKKGSAKTCVQNSILSEKGAEAAVEVAGEETFARKRKSGK